MLMQKNSNEKRNNIERGNNIRINTISSLSLQMSSLISGLLLPRLILATFGSDINGLTSSISQFLNFFSVFEGGISGVVLAALYGPSATNDNKKISEIVFAANRFLRKLGIGFVIYALVLAVFYPFSNKIFTWGFTSSLVIILSISSFIQYYFSIVPQLIVRADNKVYVYNIVGIIFNILNILLTIICINVLPEIHFVKLISAQVFLIQPIVLNMYIYKHFEIDRNSRADEGIIENRWSGFGINIANIITTNTDVIILTLFSTLKSVSVYSIYFGVVNAIKNLLMSFGLGYQSVLGQKIAQKDEEGINHYFDQYEFLSFNLAGIAFSCCICLIVPFVMIYTDGVTDTNYRQVLFSFLICLAMYVLCIREPYIQATYTAGRFKETQNYAYVEAGLNIIISIILVNAYGLIGVAAGTVISALFRYIATVVYLSKHVLHRALHITLIKQIKYLISGFVVCSCFRKCVIMNMGMKQWIFWATGIFIISIAVHLAFDFMFFRKQLREVFLTK